MKTRLLMLMSPQFCAAALAGPLQEDVTFVRQTIANEHPDIAFSTNPQTLDAALATIAATPDTLSRDEVWRRLSTLNPLLADAHLFIGYADWRGDTVAHLQAGGGLFPLEVEIAGEGKLHVKAALGGAKSDLAGARITAINGVPAKAAIAAVLQRAHGDTPLFRAHLASQRWWLYHLKLYGETAHYQLDLERDGRHWQVTLPASTQPPAIMRANDVPFHFEIHPDGSATLTAGSFDHMLKERLLTLTQAAFEQLRQQRITRLYIDISENGGGDDDLWLDGLMPYLASKPYRTGSTYTKKNARGEILTWHQPQTDKLYQGKVVVIIGPATYSSAILFANVMQDFGFATLAGVGNAARRTQSGGIRKFTLPHSGLVLWVPRFILDPPAASAHRATLLAPR
ncbi:S41 family peptidase [Duganella sp.]|uniref:S41 family peptidase n=1 Tax=Duganella sp. TaxID=1904440 RepID=UPI0031DC05B5